MDYPSPTKLRNGVWPLHRRGHGWYRASLEERLASALKHYVRTPRGSYPWAPSYGSSISFLRTQSVTEADERVVEQTLMQEIATWIPDIQILGVQLDSRESDAGAELHIRVTWGVPGFDKSGARSPTEKNLAIGPVVSTIIV